MTLRNHADCQEHHCLVGDPSPCILFRTSDVTSDITDADRHRALETMAAMNGFEGVVSSAEAGYATTPQPEGVTPMTTTPNAPHDGHTFAPGVSEDSPTPDPRWCNVCGQQRSRCTATPNPPPGERITDPQQIRAGDWITDPLLGRVSGRAGVLILGPPHGDDEGRCWTLHVGDVREAIQPAPPEPGPEVLALRHPGDEIVLARTDDGWGYGIDDPYAKAVEAGYTEWLGVIGTATP